MNNGINAISSREVAKMMEVEHKNLLQKIDEINKDLVAENSATKYWTESLFENRGKKYREYQVTKRGCEFLAHKTTGTKGNLFTDRYMDKFEEMEKQLLSPKLPTTYLEALKALVASEEKKLELEQKIENDKPLVEFATHVTESSDCLDMGDFAKVVNKENIKIGRNKLFDILRAKKILFKNNGCNVPYQTYIDKGWFNVIETVKMSVVGARTFTKVLVTGKGQMAILNILRKEENNENECI